MFNDIHSKNFNVTRYNLRTWVYASAHCAEYATVNFVMAPSDANECRRCWAKVGDWATEHGQTVGNECLNKYEPEFRQTCGCGELMDEFAVRIELFNIVNLVFTKRKEDA